MAYGIDDREKVLPCCFYMARYPKLMEAQEMSVGCVWMIWVSSPPKPSSEPDRFVARKSS
jgi:hypothetical protein